MKICFIGGGNMGSALIGGLLAKGHDPKSIVVVDPLDAVRQRLKTRFGVMTFAQCDKTAATVDVIVLAVKPQYLLDAAMLLRPLLDGQLVISIAAGIRIADLSRWLGGYRRLVRSMPNLPALIGQGIAGLFALPEVTAEEKKQAEAILATAGETLWIESDALVDAITAVSGSGPAYVFYFMEALQQGAEKLGFNAGDARKLALATFRGASLLAAQSADAPATLRAQVTSKAGTTEAAIAQMEKSGVKDAIVNAVGAAAARGRELGDQLGAQPAASMSVKPR
jgi:pyrroline-5-carboxylate reductase